MLTFFRHIRKALLDSGALAKYLLYAIGEITLVVIGILIALQINNWNQERLDKKKETEVVRALYNELKSNYDYNTARINELIWFTRLGRELLSLTGPSVSRDSKDSLSVHRKFFQLGRIYHPLTTKYRQITISEDFNLISDDSLRHLMIEYSSQLGMADVLFQKEAELGSRLETYIDDHGNTVDQIIYLSTEGGDWLSEFEDLENSKFNEKKEEMYADSKFENLIARRLKVMVFAKNRLSEVQDHILLMIDHIEAGYDW